MVVPQFPKRADAKNAVCLAALAAGVGTYVRAISAALEAKISPETKTLVYESILPRIGQISYPICLSTQKIVMVRIIYLCCMVMCH